MVSIRMLLSTATSPPNRSARAGRGLGTVAAMSAARPVASVRVAFARVMIALLLRSRGEPRAGRGLLDELRGPVEAAAAQDHRGVLGPRNVVDELVEEYLVVGRGHAHEGEGHRSEIELKEATALDGPVVVIALLLRVG